ncbi:MAG TPA: hypothetical protein VIU41_06455 [Geobacteraceae bacterium]
MGKRCVVSVILLLVTLVLFLFAPGTAPCTMVSERAIFPGKGVDRFNIGAKAPDIRKLRAIEQGEGVAIEASAGRIERISVTSPRYAVVRNRLKPGATLAEVLRFYGSGAQEVKGNLAILSYPAQGIEFAIDTADDRVRSITVFSPVRQRAPVEQQRKLYQHGEQLKAR